MQDHEKNLLLLIAIGAAIGFAKLLVSDEKLTWRLTIGRTILGAATSTIAGAIILQIPDINPLALISLASALGIMGSTFIENWLKTQSMKWGGEMSYTKDNPMKYQPELHPEPTILGFAKLPVDSITFDEAFRRLIGHEGGYSADRRDPGNWTGGKVGVGVLKGTKYGIAANTYPNLDIKNLTIAQAKEIYKKDWWDKLGGNGLHSAITFQLWDFAINAGKKRAVMELQQAVGVTADGVIGPKTMEAVNAQDLNDVILTLTAERLRFYTSLSTWSTYGKGWTNRVADNLKYAAQDN